VVLEADELGVYKVAEKYSFHHNVVDRAIRDVVAARIYLSDQTDGIGNQEILKRVEKLRLIDEELSVMAKKYRKTGGKRYLEESSPCKRTIYRLFSLADGKT